MTEQSDSPGISLTWVFDAPREAVWREWTEPERFADWYGGRENEVPLATVSMDVREGGAFRLVMLTAGGGEIEWHGEYREVRAPERLVFAISDVPGEEPVEVVAVHLIDLGDGRTEMRFEQRGEMSDEAYERAGKGWSGFLDRLAERLAV